MARITWPALAAALLHGALLALYVAAFRGDLSALVCVGRERVGTVPYETIRTGFDRFGYDGQFYYALARAPWQRHGADLDAPAARHLRVLYPAVCWLVSGGDARLLLWAMPLVNLAAIGVLAGLGAWLAARQGLSPWWGLGLPLAANVGMPALRDLTDPLSTLAVFALLVAWLRRAPWWLLGSCALAALLCREQNLVVVGVVAAAAAWGGRRAEAACVALAVAVWAGWVLALRAAYSAWPFLPGQGNFGPPLAGVLARLSPDPAAMAGNRWVHVLGLLFVGLQVLLAVYLAARRDDNVVSLVLLAGVALAVLAGPAVYEGAWSYARVLVWLPLGIWLACVLAKRPRPALLLLPAVLWPLMAVARAWAG